MNTFSKTNGSTMIKGPDGKILTNFPSQTPPDTAPANVQVVVEDAGSPDDDSRLSCASCGDVVDENTGFSWESGQTLCLDCDDAVAYATCDTCEQRFVVTDAEMERISKGWRFDCDNCTDPTRAAEYGMLSESGDQIFQNANSWFEREGNPRSISIRTGDETVTYYTDGTINAMGRVIHDRDLTDDLFDHYEWGLDDMDDDNVRVHRIEKTPETHA